VALFVAFTTTHALPLLPGRTPHGQCRVPELLLSESLTTKEDSRTAKGGAIMANQWYYSKNGDKCGPVSSSELKALARAGKLLPTDLVWKEGISSWKPAGKVKGLFPAAPMAIPLFAAAPPPVRRAIASISPLVSSSNQPTIVKLPVSKKTLVICGVGLVAISVLFAALAAICGPGLTKYGKSKTEVTGDLALLQGQWKFEKVHGDTFKDTETIWTVSGDQITDKFRYTGSEPHQTFKSWKPGYEATHKYKVVLDTTTTPPRITYKGEKRDGTRGIYKLSDRELIICLFDWNTWFKGKRGVLTNEYFDDGFPRDFYDESKQEEILLQRKVAPVILRAVRIGEPPVIAKQSPKTKTSIIWVSDGAYHSAEPIPLLYGMPQHVMDQMPPSQKQLVKKIEESQQQLALARQAVNGFSANEIREKAEHKSKEELKAYWEERQQAGGFDGWVGQILLSGGAALVFGNSYGLGSTLDPERAYMSRESLCRISFGGKGGDISDTAKAALAKIRTGAWVQIKAGPGPDSLSRLLPSISLEGKQFRVNPGYLEFCNLNDIKELPGPAPKPAPYLNIGGVEP
jgi:uncharacterized protein (TIGR03067 family)